MKSIIVIPTYNEIENVGPMIEALGKAVPDAHVLICDDSSPDGTGKRVLEIGKENPQVHLSAGPPKSGLGPAYVRGFSWCINQGYDRIVQMDCDFSHDPEAVPVLLKALDKHDLAIGSRYVLGGNTVNWPLFRRVISKGGSLYARLILGVPIDDFTGGFKAWRREALMAVDLPSIQSNGYSFQVEMNYRAALRGLRYIQIPITFVDRRVGQTKMSKKIFIEAAINVWSFRFNRRKFL